MGFHLVWNKMSQKELSLCHELKISNTCIFATQCLRPWIFQTLNSVRSNSLSLKYQRFPPLDCQNIGIGKFEFVAKTQFLYYEVSINDKEHNSCLKEFSLRFTCDKISADQIWV